MTKNTITMLTRILNTFSITTIKEVSNTLTTTENINILNNAQLITNLISEIGKLDLLQLDDLISDISHLSKQFDVLIDLECVNTTQWSILEDLVSENYTNVVIINKPTHIFANNQHTNTVKHSTDSILTTDNSSTDISDITVTRTGDIYSIDMNLGLRSVCIDECMNIGEVIFHILFRLENMNIIAKALDEFKTLGIHNVNNPSTNTLSIDIKNECYHMDYNGKHWNLYINGSTYSNNITINEVCKMIESLIDDSEYVVKMEKDLIALGLPETLITTSSENSIMISDMYELVVEDSLWYLIDTTTDEAILEECNAIQTIKTIQTINEGLRKRSERIVIKPIPLTDDEMEKYIGVYYVHMSNGVNGCDITNEWELTKDMIKGMDATRVIDLIDEYNNETLFEDIEYYIEFERGETL